MMFSMIIFISISFTCHVLCHDKDTCISIHLLSQTFLQFVAEGNKQSVMYFSTLLLSHNQNSFPFCASNCTCKGDKTLFHGKYSFSTRSKIHRSVYIVCGVSIFSIFIAHYCVFIYIFQFFKYVNSQQQFGLVWRLDGTETLYWYYKLNK